MAEMTKCEISGCVRQAIHKIYFCDALFSRVCAAHFDEARAGLVEKLPPLKDRRARHWTYPQTRPMTVITNEKTRPSDFMSDDLGDFDEFEE